MRVASILPIKQLIIADTIFVFILSSTVNHIQSKLVEESLKVWLQRKHADHIILLDWKSTLESAVIRTPLRTLKDALYKVRIIRLKFRIVFWKKCMSKEN